MLTPEEITFLRNVGGLMNEFCRLPPAHPSDTREMEFHIHAIQNLVMARSACRSHPNEFPWLGERTAKVSEGELAESFAEVAAQHEPNHLIDDMNPVIGVSRVAICRNCGNTGVGIMGEQCGCQSKVEEWEDRVQQEVATDVLDRDQQLDNAQARNAVEQIKARRELASAARQLLPRLLIASGLVKGITPSSIRRECGAAIPDFVSSWRAGDGVGGPKADC